MKKTLITNISEKRKGDEYVTTVDARNKFSTIINRASFGKERIILTRRGEDIAALVPIDDIELLDMVEDMIIVQEAKEALAEAKKKGTVSWRDFKKKLG